MKFLKIKMEGLPEEMAEVISEGVLEEMLYFWRNSKTNMRNSGNHFEGNFLEEFLNEIFKKKS